MTKNRRTRHEDLNEALLNARAADDSSRPDATDVLVAKLFDYANPVLIDMMKKGTLHTSLRRPLRLHQQSLDSLRDCRYTQEDLAAEIIVGTYPSFIQNELEEPDKGWKPDKGASVGTWFLNACLFRAHHVLRQWDTKHRQNNSMVDALGLQRLRQPDLESQALVRQLLLQAPHSVRPILAAVAAGFEIEDAARDLNISGSTARSRLYQFRRNTVGRLISMGVIPPEMVPEGHKLQPMSTGGEEPLADA
ncbi:hypothetical protein O4158_22010 [Gordonia amicalis]|uniref:hypothetical protein n=1 Tax=Gordonia amicalis TaxID=89053 RepID=UPI0022B2D5E5|nr:hypothetical protein [Gordonia amicalis]MCZ4581712.1 hypothetical protein [Gordonia amicalis]